MPSCLGSGTVTAGADGANRGMVGKVRLLAPLLQNFFFGLSIVSAYETVRNRISRMYNLFTSIQSFAAILYNRKVTIVQKFLSTYRPLGIIILFTFYLQL